MTATVADQPHGTPVWQGRKAPTTVEWLRGVAQMQALEQEWVALEAAVQERTPLSTFDYLVSWYTRYAGDYGGDPLIGIARRGACLVGVAPLAVRRGRVGRIPVTRVDFVPHDAEAGEFLVEDDHPETVAAFVESLSSAVKFDVMCLNGLDPASDQFMALLEAAARCQLAVERADHPYAEVDLRGGYHAYCRAMSRNFRRSLKRQAQRVAAAGRPAVEGVQDTAGDAEGDAVARVIAITEASYKLHGQPLARCHRDFIGDLVSRFGPRGMLSLWFLSIDGKDAAFLMGLIERQCFYDVTLAYVEAFAHLSPGVYLMQRVLETLAAAGVLTLVSHGAHDYKRRWATAFVPRTRVFLFSPGVRGAASRLVRFSLGPVWRRLGQPEA